MLVEPKRVTLSKYMGLLFSGVSDFIYSEDDLKIKGVTSHDGQLIVFKNMVEINVIWQDLKNVELELSKIVAW